MSVVVIIEDQASMRIEMRLLLERSGHDVHIFASAEEADSALDHTGALVPDLLLVDVRLPGESGLDLVRRLADDARLPPTIMVSGEATLTEAVEAVQLREVVDFIEKPFQPERLVHSVNRALEFALLRHEVYVLRQRERSGRTILGESPGIRSVRAFAARAAESSATVLIQGESGTGKELVAEALHDLGPRAGKPLVKVNCAAIPSQLIEDELFGHVRGAYTDARADRAGVFEQAHQGTLFLDEIGDMNVALQARLLRILEDGRVRRVGATGDRLVDVRIVAATNRDLQDLEGDGGFRRDLYYRLGQLVLVIPPLRERAEDVPVLLERFLTAACARLDRPVPRLTELALRHLERHRWPGNVRELRNVCERLAVFGPDIVTPADLPSTVIAVPDDGPPADADMTLREARRHCERAHILSALQASGGNVTEAARRLQVNRSHLHTKMAELGISRSGERD
jgi:two-component system nitrogen regulation response regulator NtrX